MPRNRLHRLQTIRHWLFHHRITVAIIVCALFFIISTLAYFVKTKKSDCDLDNSSNLPHSREDCYSTNPENGTPTNSDSTPVSSADNSIIGIKEMATKDSDYSEWRLDGSCVPKGYDLTLNPDLETGNYTGTLKITFEALKKIEYIKLNSQGITFDKSAIWQDSEDFSNHGDPVFDEKKGKSFLI